MIGGDSSDQVEILRAELAELRQQLELYREAFGECIGRCGEDLIAHVETLVRKLEEDRERVFSRAMPRGLGTLMCEIWYSICQTMSDYDVLCGNVN